jgi:hypothetical protein
MVGTVDGRQVRDIAIMVNAGAGETPLPTPATP